jgi:endonuclease-3
MTQKQKKERMAVIVDRLKEIYPAAVCALEWGGQTGELDRDAMLRESWKLLVMARLSAQCTDARVNLVCRDLFARYPTVTALAEADLSELESIIRPCGLFRTKADSIKRSCEILVKEFDGIVPSDMDTLLSLPGVGRKIANLLRGDIYRLPAVVADTHCIRICGRFGMYPETLKDPTKVERILSGLIRPDEQNDFCHRIVQFGRDVCMARSPACEDCPLRDVCEHGKTS